MVVERVKNSTRDCRIYSVHNVEDEGEKRGGKEKGLRT